MKDDGAIGSGLWCCSECTGDFCDPCILYGQQIQDCHVRFTPGTVGAVTMAP